MYSTLALLSVLFLDTIHAQQAVPTSSFKTYQPEFASLLGDNAKITLLAQSNISIFHEAGVYHSPTKALFVVSDRLNIPTLNNNATTIITSRITGLDSPSTIKLETLPDIGIPDPHGAYIYPGTSPDRIVFLGQGTRNLTGAPAGVYSFNPYPPYNATNILGNYGRAGPFNSPNDITVTPDGGIWFTDPVYGWEYGFRHTPTLPNQVYRYDPKTASVRVMADGFGRPNGIATNADGSIIYVGDTGAQVGNGTIDTTGPRTIYAFDVQGLQQGGGGFLGNKRVFAMPDYQGPDGIKVDTKGNVYSGVADGVHVWNAGGVLIGKVLLGGGAGNIGFGEDGVLFALGGNYLWRIDFDAGVVGSTPG